MPHLERERRKKRVSRRSERKVTGLPRGMKGQRFLLIRTRKPMTFIVRPLRRMRK